jgi:hypothetical protein
VREEYRDGAKAIYNNQRSEMVGPIGNERLLNKGPAISRKQLIEHLRIYVSEKGWVFGLCHTPSSFDTAR